jgi:hypothetical protein
VACEAAMLLVCADVVGSQPCVVEGCLLVLCEYCVGRCCVCMCVWLRMDDVDGNDMFDRHERSYRPVVQFERTQTRTHKTRRSGKAIPRGEGCAGDFMGWHRPCTWCMSFRANTGCTARASTCTAHTDVRLGVDESVLVYARTEQPHTPTKVVVANTVRKSPRTCDWDGLPDAKFGGTGCDMRR